MLLFDLVLLVLGFLGLYIGSKFVILGLENLAYYLKVSHITVGLTILAIGTSLPEIAVSMIGGFDKLTGISPNIDDIVIGNKIGSFIVNMTLIIGILASIRPISVSKWELRRDVPMLYISALIFLLCAFDGTISQIEAILMIVIYIIYLIFIVWSEKKIAKHMLEAEILQKERLDLKDFETVAPVYPSPSIKKEIGIFLIGLFILLFSAEITVLNALSLANDLSVPENVIGIIIVGIGTSIPELVVDLTAVKRGSYGIAVGDILGSNICDILFATSSGAIIIGFKVAPVILLFDLPILFIFITVASYFLWREKTLKRWEGFILICLYSVYVILKISFFQNI